MTPSRTHQQQGFSSTLIIVLIVAVLAVAGGAWYAVSQSKNINTGSEGAMMEDPANKSNATGEDEAMAEEKEEEGATIGNANAPQQTNGTAPEDSPTSQSTPGTHTAYSEATYAAAKNQQRVLFFHANWCPTCRAANADITKRLDEIPDKVVILKTDYDTENALKSKYGITYQHTFVLVDDDGNALKKWNGGGLDEIIANLN